MVSAKRTPDYFTTTLGLSLRPGHEGEFERLRRLLANHPGFQLILLQFNDPPYRDQVIGKLNVLVEHSTVLDLRIEALDTFQAFERHLASLAKQYRVIHVVNLESWLKPEDGNTYLITINYRREAIAQDCPAALLLWMTEPTLKAFAINAPDAWAWRTSVIDFSVVKSVLKLEDLKPAEFVEGMLLQRRIARINEISAFLDSSSETSTGLSEAGLLNELGKLYFSIGKYTEALEFLLKALKILRELGNRASEGVILNNISQIYQAQGDYDTALDYLKQALAIQQTIGNRASEGATLNNLAAIYQARGDYDTALDYLKQALAIQQTIGNRTGEGTTFNNLAQIYDARGDYDTALDYLKQALAIWQAIGDHAGEGTTFNNLSAIYNSHGDYDTALDYLKQALAIWQAIGNRIGEGTTLNNLAAIYQARGDYDTALDYLKQSLAIQQTIGDRAGLCSTLFNLGHIYLAKKDAEQAMSAFLDAYVIAKEINLAAELEHLADLAKQLGGYGLEYWEQLSSKQASPAT